MSQETVVLTTNRLQIRPPTRIWGVAHLLVSTALVLFLVARSPSIFEEIREVVERMQRYGAEAWDSTGAIMPRLPLAFVTLSALLAIYHAMRGVAVGFRHLLRVFPTSGIPGEIGNAQSAVEDLCRNRTIRFASGESDTDNVASIIPHIRFLTEPQRVLVQSLWQSIVLWSIFLALLSAPRFVPQQYLDELPAELSLSEPWPLPINLAMVGAATVAALFLSVLSSVRRVPRVAVQEERIQIDSGGNPIDMYLQLRQTFEDVRMGDFPNREILATRPRLGRSREGDTDSFSGGLMLERQPEPLSRGLAANALILDAAGAALRAGGYGILLYFPFEAASLKMQALASPSVSNIVPLIMMLLAGVLASSRGTRFLNMAYLLHHVFRFRSDLYWMQMEGTYSVGHSGLGDGRGGTVHVARAHMQSRTHVHLFASSVVTECADLNGPRVIVDCRPDASFQGRVDHLRDALDSLEGKGERLPTVDLADEGVANIVQANAQIEGLAHAARSGASHPNQLESEMKPSLPSGDSSAPQSKTCPECGEEVRIAARKCRFCNFRFEPATETAQAPEHSEGDGPGE